MKQKLQEMSHLRGHHGNVMAVLEDCVSRPLSAAQFAHGENWEVSFCFILNVGQLIFNFRLSASGENLLSKGTIFLFRPTQQLTMLELSFTSSALGELCLINQVISSFTPIKSCFFLLLFYVDSPHFHKSLHECLIDERNHNRDGTGQPRRWFF